MQGQQKRALEEDGSGQEPEAKKARRAEEDSQLGAPVTLAFVGTRGVGKSGLINTILIGGRPEGTTRDPAYPLPSRLGERGVTRHFLRVARRDVPATFSITCASEKINVTCASFEELAPALDALRAAPGAVVDVTGPFPGLPAQVTLIDCPGWGDASLARYYQLFTGTVDAIIVVSARDETNFDSDAMREAMFLALPTSGLTESAPRSLVMNACFNGFNTAYDYGITYYEHVPNCHFSRDHLSTERLIACVREHALAEARRVSEFRRAMDENALEAGIKPLVKQQSSQTCNTEADRLMLYSLHAGMPNEEIHSLCVQPDPLGLLLYMNRAYTRQALKLVQQRIDALCDALNLHRAHFAHWAHRWQLPSQTNALYLAATECQSQWTELDTLGRFLLVRNLLDRYQRVLLDAGQTLIRDFVTAVKELALNTFYHAV